MSFLLFFGNDIFLYSIGSAMLIFDNPKFFLRYRAALKGITL